MTGQETFDNRFLSPSGSSRVVSVNVATGAITDLPAGPGTKMSAGFVGASDVVGYVRKSVKDPGIYYSDSKAGPHGSVRAATWSPDGSHVLHNTFIGVERVNGKRVFSREPGLADATLSDGCSSIRSPAFRARRCGTRGCCPLKNRPVSKTGLQARATKASLRRRG
jgi:hypothetical protein